VRARAGGKVISPCPLSSDGLTDGVNDGWVLSLDYVLQEVERAFRLFKARQVADQQGSGAVAVVRARIGQEGEEEKALLDFAVHHMKGDLFSDLMEYMA
jgi:hypothetical protein